MTSPIFPDPPKHLVSLNSLSTENRLYCLLAKIPDGIPKLELKKVRSKLDRCRLNGARLVQGFGRNCREIYQKDSSVSRLWNIANDDLMATSHLSLICFEGKPDKVLVSKILRGYEVKIWFRTDLLFPFSREVRDLLSWQKDYKTIRLNRGEMIQFFEKWIAPSQLLISSSVKDKLKEDFESVEIVWNDLIFAFERNVAVRNCAKEFFEDLW
jgi:hypothetical protein